MQQYLHVRTTQDHLFLDGELDLGSTNILVGEVESSARRGPVTLDLSGLSFIDSTGMKTLIDLKQTRVGLRIVNPTADTLRLFDLVGIGTLLLDG